jgi:hypothetical protein
MRIHADAFIFRFSQESGSEAQVPVVLLTREKKR